MTVKLNIIELLQKLERSYGKTIDVSVMFDDVNSVFSDGDTAS